MFEVHETKAVQFSKIQRKGGYTWYSERGVQGGKGIQEGNVASGD